MARSYAPPRHAENTPHVAAFRDAVSDAGKPIILKLAFAIDGGHKPKGLKPGKDFSVVTLDNTAEYVDVRREMKKIHDVNLPGRVLVAHGDDLMTHEEFAIDDSGVKRKKIHDETKILLPEHDSRGAETSMAKGKIHFGVFKRRDVETSVKEWSRYIRQVRGVPFDAPGDDVVGKYVVYDRFELQRDAIEQRKVVTADEGVYFIARARVNLIEARKLQGAFQHAHDNGGKIPNLWLDARYDIFTANQVDSRPYGFESLAIEPRKDVTEQAEISFSYRNG